MHGLLPVVHTLSEFYCALQPLASSGEAQKSLSPATERNLLHAHANESMKFLTTCLPLSVMMLSGWNCTPCKHNEFMYVDQKYVSALQLNYSVAYCHWLGSCQGINARNMCMLHASTKMQYVISAAGSSMPRTTCNVNFHSRYPAHVCIYQTVAKYITACKGGLAILAQTCSEGPHAAVQ